MTADPTENWHDDHIPEPLRALRRRMVKAEWDVHSAQIAFDDAEIDLRDAVAEASERSARYHEAVAAWKAEHPEEQEANRAATD